MDSTTAETTITPETPQTLTIKSVTVVYDKTIGENTSEITTALGTPTQAMADALKPFLVEPEFTNVNVIA